MMFVRKLTSCCKTRCSHRREGELRTYCDATKNRKRKKTKKSDLSKLIKLVMKNIAKPTVEKEAMNVSEQKKTAGLFCEKSQLSNFNEKNRCT